MSEIIVEPVLQSLGMQGEHFFIKVKFPIVSEKAEVIGFRGLVLKMKAEDLPAHTEEAETVRFDVGKAWEGYNRNERGSSYGSSLLDEIREGKRITTHTMLDLVVENLLECKRSEFVDKHSFGHTGSPIDLSLEDVISKLDEWLRGPEIHALKTAKVCPGCHMLKDYNPDSWGNISNTGGTLYACANCYQLFLQAKERERNAQQDKG
jgi:hypothetical protein